MYYQHGKQLVPFSDRPGNEKVYQGLNPRLAELFLRERPGRILEGAAPAPLVLGFVAEMRRGLNDKAAAETQEVIALLEIAAEARLYRETTEMMEWIRGRRTARGAAQ